MMSIMLIWPMKAMSDILLVIAVIVIIVLVAIIVELVARLRRRGSYNLEFPADFVQKSSADEDMNDRFQGKHWK